MNLHFLPPPAAACPDGCGDHCSPRSTIAQVPHLEFPRDPVGAMLIPKAGARPAPVIADEGPARRLLRELLDHADVIAEAPGGGAFLLVDVPLYALNELAIFNAELEDLENDDPAEDADTLEDDDPAEDDEVDEESDDAGDWGYSDRNPADIAIRERLRTRLSTRGATEPSAHPVLGVYRRISGRG